MRRVFVLFVVTLIFTPAFSANLKVTVGGIASQKGEVRVAVCDKKTFLKKCPYTQHAKPNDASKLSFDFSNMPAGQYALMAYHDENENGKLDRNFIGIPQEGHGFSRQAKGNFGPPKFKAAAFELQENGTEQLFELEY